MVVCNSISVEHKEEKLVQPDDIESALPNPDEATFHKVINNDLSENSTYNKSKQYWFESKEL